MRHFFAINPKSFRKEEYLERFLAEVKSTFSKDGAEPYIIYLSRRPRDMVVVARREAEAHPDEIIRFYAVGGDGIMFDCLNGIINIPNTQLTNIPYGNSNDFLLNFGKKNRSKFLDVNELINGDVIPTDVMHCNNSYAINICCVGIEAGATAFAHTPHKLFEKSPLHRFLYPVIYLLGAVRHFFNKDLMEQHYNIMLDGKDVSGSYNSISMGNGQYYGGGKRPYPYAVQTDGKLDLVLIKNITILNSVKSMLRFLTGNFEKEPDKFLYHRAENIAITSDASLYITLDCETFFDSGMNIEMHKQAIDFVVPKGVSYMNATE